MRTGWLAPVLCIGLLAPAAPAQDRGSATTAENRRSVAVTITQSQIGVVREVRALPDGGGGRLRVLDLPTGFQPRSLAVRGVDEGARLRVRGIHWLYDLLTPERLLEQSVGREVELVEPGERGEMRTTRARLLAVQGGPVYEVDGRILLYHQGRVLIPDAPRNLVPRPELVLDLDGRAREVELSYITDGMSWSADYVLSLAAEGGRADLTGWATIDNRSGTSYRNADLTLSAGDINRVTPEMDMMMKQEGRLMGRVGVSAAAPPANFAEESFSQRHLYKLDQPATLENNRTTQMPLFDTISVPVVRKLVLRGEPHWYRAQMGGLLAQDRRVAILLEVENADREGPGVPLPRGIVRVFERDRAGVPQLAGEAWIDHTPRGETLRLAIGESFDVVADHTQTDFQQINRRTSESSYEVKIRNRSEENVTVVVREPVGGDWKIVRSSLPGKKVDATTLEFEVPVPKGEEVTLTYTVRVTW